MTRPAKPSDQHNGLALRPATEQDAGVVAELMAEMARSFGAEPEASKDSALVYLRHPDCHALLATVGTTVAGLVAYRVHPDLYHGAPSGSIGQVVVRGGFRRRGVASEMLRRVIDELWDAGCAEISLSVDPEDADTQRLYRSLGLIEESLQLERHRTSLR